MPGELLIGLTSQPVESAFAFANTHHFGILSLTGYSYRLPYRKDSLAQVSSWLDTKLYINKRVMDQVYKGDTFWVSNWAEVTWDSLKNQMWLKGMFVSFDGAAQADWIQTKNQFHFTEHADSIILGMLVRIPAGQEQATINLLKGDPSVRYAEVNHVWKIDPL